ncbi:helix-turn-helix domain-containing protein [Paenibacillus chungangensis]|uniref:Helix-turn-helix domain-containing protein n=1 Tax=Paenibacillus chungangensis TaxID=696535 RepID=A0ABW3HL73_9BACL
MMRKRLQNPLFYRFLLSYLLVLGLPIVIMGLTLYTLTLGLLKEHAYDANWRMLSQISEKVDTEFREIMQISAKLMYYRELFEAPANETVHNLQNQNLLNYVISSEFIDELAIYSYNNRTIISNQSSYSQDVFKRQFAIQAEKSGDIIGHMQSISKPEFSLVHKINPSGEKDRYYVYYVPLPINSNEPKGIALFFIDEMKFTKLLGSLTENKAGNALIADQAGHILTSLYPIEQAEAFVREQITSSGHPVKKPLQYKDVKYQTFHVTSSSNGYHYMMMTPHDELMEAVYHLRNRGFMALALILIAGSIIIFLLMHMNFNPLQELIEFVESKWGSRSAQTRGIGQIRKALQLAEQLELDMKEKMERSVPALRQQMLGDLLRGLHDDLDAFNEQGKSLGLRLQPVPTQVAVIELPDADNDSSELMDKLEEAAGHESTGRMYVISLIEQGRVAILYQKSDCTETMNLIWSDLHSTLAQELGSPPTIGVGTFQNTLHELPISFLQANSSLNYASVMGRGIVISFEGIQQLELNSNGQPELDFDALKQYLLTGKFMEARELIAEFIQKIMKESGTLFQATSLCFEITNFVWRVLQDVPGFQQQRIVFPDMITLSRIHTIKELGERVYTVCDEAFKQVERMISNDLEDEFISSVMRYLQRHALVQDFAIQNMADELSCSVSHLRRIFKEQTGQTIYDYVNELRMNQAKALLAETDHPVQEIVQKVGYSDVSSFIRKFKQVTMMTPGEYRKAGVLRRKS